MAEVNPPIWMQVGTYPAGVDRILVDVLFAREGRIREDDLKLTAPGGMFVSIDPGFVAVRGNTTANQGKYLCKNDAAVSLAVGTADLTRPRIDIVIAEVKDNTEDAGGLNLWRLRVVQGTPNASPAEPATPNNSWKIGVINVGINASAIVTGNLVQNAVARSYGYGAGPIPVNDDTDRDAMNPKWTGMTVMKMSGTWPEYWDGAAWRAVRNAVPHKDAVNIVPSINEVFSATAFTNLTGSARTRVTGFTKYRDSSKLVVTARLPILANAAFSTNNMYLIGALISGTTYEIGRHWIKLQASGDTPGHVWGITAPIAGIAAGTYTIELQAYSLTSSAIYLPNTDTITLCVEETY